jgi:hypothetical protein
VCQAISPATEDPADLGVSVTPDDPDRRCIVTVGP